MRQSVFTVTTVAIVSSLSLSLARADEAACVAAQKQKLQPELVKQVEAECSKAKMQAGYAAAGTNSLVVRLNQLIPAAGSDRRTFNQNSRNGSDLGAGGDVVSVLPDKQVSGGAALRFRHGAQAGKQRDCRNGGPLAEAEERLHAVDAALRSYCGAVAAYEKKVAAGEKKAKAPKEPKQKALLAKLSSKKGECVTSGRLTDLVNKHANDPVVKKYLSSYCGKKL